MNDTHIFHDQSFWQHFKQQVHSKKWNCKFPDDILFQNMTQDTELYKDDAIFRQRRKLIIPWLDNEHQWNKTLLGAGKEIANDRRGIHSRILQNLHMFDAYKDFVDHLNCFYTVYSTMAAKGFDFQPISQYSSEIHDMDKLDPVMLLGYSERFEDEVSTSVWELCVERHVHVNPHHQVHCMWHDCEEDNVLRKNDCEENNVLRNNDCEEDSVLRNNDCEEDSVLRNNDCEEDNVLRNNDCEEDNVLRNIALREMVCDKVSRRLQKNLGGVVCEDMWNVEGVFFNGLPDKWMEKARNTMKVLKQNGVSVSI